MNISSDCSPPISFTDSAPILQRKTPGDARIRILVFTGNAFKKREFERILGNGYGANVTFADDPVEEITDSLVRGVLAESPFTPHYLIREKSRLYDALRSTELDGLRLVDNPEEAPHFIHSVSKLRVWKPIWNKDSTLARVEALKFVHQIKGFIDPSRKEMRDNQVFGWDHLFVSACSELSCLDLIQMGHDKASPRQMVISDFVTCCLFYKEPQALTHHLNLKPKKAVEFSLEMSVSTFMLNDPLLSNPYMSIWGLDRIRNRVLDEGVFFKAATSRPVKNYFTPPFGGIPLTSKKSCEEETVFMLHDLNHHNIPDLIFDGEDSVEARNIYLVWRMMSEAMTLVIADMLYAHTLVLTDPENRCKVDSRIFPLFEALNIEFQTTESRNEIMRQLLWANTQYAVLGDDQEWVKLLKPGNDDKLSAYKNHFEKFFVGDHVWTEANYKNMAAKKETYKAWIDGIGKEHFRESNLLLLSDMVEKIRGRGANLFSIKDVVRYVFDEIFETRIAQSCDNLEAVSEDEKLSRAFRRYMIGQMSFYAHYRSHQGMAERGRALSDRLAQTSFFDAAEMNALREQFARDVRYLWGLGVITTEAADNHLQLHPIFPPVYISYARQESKSVKEVLEKLYGGVDPVYVNTSNPGKLAEYKEYFFPRTVVAQAKDLSEPEADPLTIIQYKASQFEDGVLVDDVSLDIEGADIGTHIRWHLDDLPRYIGRKCTYVCRTAIRSKEIIKIFESAVRGQLVAPRGDCFGFGKYFLPDGTDLTLGEKMDRSFNARSLALEKFKADAPTAVLPVLDSWEGDFQAT